MREIKLLPCPFCGGEAKLERKVVCYGHGEYVEVAYIKCEECSCRTGEMWNGNIEQRVKDAIQSWNRRKPMQEIVEKLESKKKNI